MALCRKTQRAEGQETHSGVMLAASAGCQGEPPQGLSQAQLLRAAPAVSTMPAGV